MFVRMYVCIAFKPGIGTDIGQKYDSSIGIVNCSDFESWFKALIKEPPLTLSPLIMQRAIRYLTFAVH